MEAGDRSDLRDACAIHQSSHPPLNIEDSDVLEKAIRVAKHLTTVSCLLPRPLLLDARGSVSDFNAVPLKGDRV